MNRAEAIYRLIHDQPEERRRVVAVLTGKSRVYATTTVPGVGSMLFKLTPAEREELLALLKDEPGDQGGVREPRRPRPPRSGAAGAVAVAERETPAAVAVGEPREVY